MLEKKLEKRIGFVKDMFLVPGIIGGSGCTYKDFQQFVAKTVATCENLLTKFLDF